MDDLADLPTPVYAEAAPLSDLRASELLVVVSTRLYVLPRVANGLRADWRGGLCAAGVSEAGVGAFHAFFTIVGHGQRRPLDIHCACRRVLGADEARLLQLISLFQHDRPETAEAILGDWLAPSARRLATTQAGVMATALKDAGLTIPWRHAEAATMRQLDRTDSGLALLH